MVILAAVLLVFPGQQIKSLLEALACAFILLLLFLLVMGYERGKCTQLLKLFPW